MCAAGEEQIRQLVVMSQIGKGCHGNVKLLLTWQAKLRVSQPAPEANLVDQFFDLS